MGRDGNGAQAQLLQQGELQVRVSFALSRPGASARHRDAPRDDETDGIPAPDERLQLFQVQLLPVLVPVTDGRCPARFSFGHVLRADADESPSQAGRRDDEGLAVGQGHGPHRKLGCIGVDFDHPGLLVERRLPQEAGGRLGAGEIGDPALDGKRKAGCARLAQAAVGQPAGGLFGHLPLTSPARAFEPPLSSATNASGSRADAHGPPAAGRSPPAAAGWCVELELGPQRSPREVAQVKAGEPHPEDFPRPPLGLFHLDARDLPVRDLDRARAAVDQEAVPGQLVAEPAGDAKVRENQREGKTDDEERTSSMATMPAGFSRPRGGYWPVAPVSSASANARGTSG